MRAAISRIHFPIRTLGPGERLGIWFQGCSIRCAGCISTDTWPEKTPDIEIAELVSQIELWIADCDGVTISGGEPFDQPEALVCLVRAIKALKPVDVLIYSGHPFERITGTIAQMNQCVDAVISDPFLVSENQTIALRGSDNQRLTVLTPLGAAKFSAFDRLRTTDDDHLDLMMDNDGNAWMAGIPRRGDLTKLRDLISANGNHCRTTEAPVHSRERGP